MASNLKFTMKRHNGADLDNLYPMTTWSQVQDKPSTYTPTAHTHTEYAPTAGSSSITTLGTIGTGTWQGSIINSTYGGTGVNNGGRTLKINTNSGTIGFTNASTTLTVANTASISGTNTGDQTTITGNAGSATTLQTPRTLTIGSTGKTFNGGADVSWSLAEIGAASSSSLASHTSSTSNPHSVTASQIGLGTTATPIFSGINLGAGSNTWAIDDATSNTLSFKLGATEKFKITSTGISTSGTISAGGDIGATGNLNIGAIYADGPIYGQSYNGPLGYVSDPPTEALSYGLGFYVSSYDPPTKYPGWIYIIM